MTRKPVVFDLEPDDQPAQSVSDAPPVPELDEPTALQATVEAVGTARRRGWGGWLWGLVLGLLGTIISVAAWDYATSLIDRVPVLGLVVSGAMIGLLLAALVFCVRELAALGRLHKVDTLRQACRDARSGDLAVARAQVARLSQFYGTRADLEWARRRLHEREPEILDADGLMDLAEAELLSPLDVQALAEVQTAARQVAGVTALVPLALADVITALVSSLRMIRRIAEIYGGRSGLFSSWRLTRAVLSHLVATGAVAVGDDLLEPVLGGSVLSKLSRRFGEGLINGALTVRVGLAAIEVCRPMDFASVDKPRLSVVLQRALKGFVK
jgi:putative membrane protein